MKNFESMLKYIFYTSGYIFRFILIWIIFFLLNRIFFGFFFIEEISTESIVEILTVFPKSFSLDISFISYMLVPIIVLIWLNYFLSNKQFILKVIYFIICFFFLVSGLINGSEAALYSEWQTKLNFSALSHFKHPQEVFSSATIGHIFTSLFFLFISLIFIRLYQKKVHVMLSSCSSLITFKKVLDIPISLLVLFLSFGILLLGIRGGIQPIPVNLSDAYFSNKIILNDIAVNSNWNIVQSILKSKSGFEGNPYKKYSNEDVERFMRNLKNNENDSNIYVLNSKTPNIVFILLESWSADNIESLGGLKGITPNFQLLEKNGLLFTEFYSNGYKSDQAMTSVFSSFPVLPYVSIINQSDKARKLPSLNKSLKDYHSSYFFGGQLTYGNIKGYLLSQGFDLVKDENDYKYLPSGRLGVHDEFMFTQFRKELNELPQPFMSTLFTISSHSPYDFPAEHMLSFDSKEDKYVNSVAYTDKCLGEFMRKVKNEDWYENTLFIIIADHSHNSPLKRRVAQKEKFHIPMLWFGDVLKDEFKGSKYNKIASHLDISPTLLNQLHITSEPSYFGQNILNSNIRSFVPFSFIRGYGAIKENSNYAYSITYNKPLEKRFESEEMTIIKEIEMYMQYAFMIYSKY